MKMKKCLFPLAFLCLAACQQKASRPVAKPAPRATIVFLTEKSHDFGTYSEKDTVAFDFVFRNDGTIPYVVNRVEPSCGCVRVSYPKYPVAPGAVDSFHVVYDGNGFMPGFFVKRCDVYSNAEDSVFSLRIQGTFAEKK